MSGERSADQAAAGELNVTSVATGAPSASTSNAVGTRRAGLAALTEIREITKF
jgi:hypothetical protein